MRGERGARPANGGVRSTSARPASRRRARTSNPSLTFPRPVMLISRCSLSFGLVALGAAISAGCADSTAPRPLAPSSISAAKAPGGGGGGAPSPGLLNAAGVWTVTTLNNLGQVFNVATLTLQQDASGNLTGTECDSIDAGAPGACFTMFGKVTNTGTLELLGTLNYKGTPTPITCPDGSAGLGISGSFFNRGLVAGTQVGDNCAR
jgi:hypothetical protein